MRIDPHLQVEVVKSTDEVITAHVTLTRPEIFVYLDDYEDRSSSKSRSSRKHRRGNYSTCNSYHRYSKPSIKVSSIPTSVA